mgnify:CR=1 FL=1
MLLFTGQAEIAIDDKQRLSIPAKFRSQLPVAEAGMSWFSVPWPTNSIIRLYPEDEFRRLTARFGGSIAPTEDEAELETTLLSVSEQVSMDKNYRVRLPAWQLEELGLSGDVMVLGVRNRLEVWSRDVWNQSRRERFGRLQQLVERIDARQRGGAPNATTGS